MALGMSHVMTKKGVNATLVESLEKEGTINKEGTLKEGTLKEGTLKEGTLKGIHFIVSHYL